MGNPATWITSNSHFAERGCVRSTSRCFRTSQVIGMAQWLRLGLSATAALQRQNENCWGRRVCLRRGLGCHPEKNHGPWLWKILCSGRGQGEKSPNTFAQGNPEPKIDYDYDYEQDYDHDEGASDGHCLSTGV
jgi:hypothetical protein